MTQSDVPAHTPGPWCVVYDAGYATLVRTADDEHNIANASMSPWAASHRLIEEANARLIAASPDLLEALTVIANASARSETMFGGKMSEVTRVFENITRVSRSAIAKATGQQVSP